MNRFNTTMPAIVLTLALAAVSTQASNALDQQDRHLQFEQVATFDSVLDDHLTLTDTDLAIEFLPVSLTAFPGASNERYSFTIKPTCEDTDPVLEGSFGYYVVGDDLAGTPTNFESPTDLVAEYFISFGAPTSATYSFSTSLIGKAKIVFCADVRYSIDGTLVSTNSFPFEITVAPDGSDPTTLTGDVVVTSASGTVATTTLGSLSSFTQEGQTFDRSLDTVELKFYHCVDNNVPDTRTTVTIGETIKICYDYAPYAYSLTMGAVTVGGVTISDWSAPLYNHNYNGWDQWASGSFTFILTEEHFLGDTGSDLTISTTISWAYIGFLDWDPVASPAGVLDAAGTTQVIPAIRRLSNDGLLGTEANNNNEAGSTPVSTTLHVVNAAQLEQIVLEEEAEVQALLHAVVEEEKDDDDQMDFILFGGIIFGICGTLFGTCAICLLLCVLLYRRKKEEEEEGKHKSVAIAQCCDEENPRPRRNTTGTSAAMTALDNDESDETATVTSRWFL